MYLHETFDDLKQGKWIRRNAWHHRYAIQLCNVDYNKPFDENRSVFFFSTLNGFFWLGNNSPPLQNEEFYQQSHRSNDGLNNDLFCDDWHVCEHQYMYDGILERTKLDSKKRLDEIRRKEISGWRTPEEKERDELENSRDRWNWTFKTKRPFDIDDPTCDDCTLSSCEKCPIVLDPYQPFLDMFYIWRAAWYEERKNDQ